MIGVVNTLLTAFLILDASAYQIRYTDCREVSHLQSLDKNSLCGQDHVNYRKPEVYDLLQLREISKIPGFSCQVVKSSTSYFCGAYSHLKVVSLPQYSIPVSVSPSECQKMIVEKEFTSPHGVKYDLELNARNIFQSTELGSISLVGGEHGAACQGQQTRIGGIVLDGIIEVDQFEITLLEEKFEITPSSFLALNTHTDLSDCHPSDNGCQTNIHTFVWNQPRHQCQYERIRTVSLAHEQGFLVDHSAKLLFSKVGTPSPSPLNCPGEAVVRTTQHHKLVLGTRSMAWPRIDGAEIDLALEVKLTSEYLSFQFSAALSQSVSGMDKTLCDRTMGKFAVEDTFQVHNDTFGRIRGDLLYLFKCSQKTGSIVSSDHCITDLKLASAQGYVSPTTRLWKATTAPRACQVHYPAAHKVLTGWVVAEPQVKSIPTPEFKALIGARSGYLKPEIFDSSSMLYTSEEITSWKQSLIEASYSKDVQAKLHHGLCQGSQICRSEHKYNDQTIFSLSSLTPEKVLGSLNPWARFKAWLDESAAVLCLIVLILEGTKVFTYILTFANNLYRQGFVAALFCCVSILFPKWSGASRQEQSSHPTAPEQQPLTEVPASQWQGRGLYGQVPQVK